MKPRGILFLCVANSARSQIAEGIARSLAPTGVAIYSAGTAPGTLHPVAVEALREVGIDPTGQHSKGIPDVPLGQIGTVVTLCADEVCPVLPGVVRRLHWPQPDPVDIEDFRAVIAAVRPRIQALLDEI